MSFNGKGLGYVQIIHNTHTCSWIDDDDLFMLGMFKK